MKILFIGDGLIKGTKGVNWVKRLATKHPHWKVENAGENGETIGNVYCRLKKLVRKDPNYDIIIILAGANDILFPTLAQRGFFFRRIYNQLLRKGCKPFKEPKAFEAELRKMIMFLQQDTKARIVLTTISCINEDLQAPINAHRKQFNSIIRTVASEANCRLADVAALCDGCLLRLQTRDYLLNDFLNTTCFDKVKCLVPGQADALSKKRALHLTIDGLHPNSEGARFFVEEIERQVY